MNVAKKGAAAPSKVSAFDLDHTLIQVNSSYQFGRYLFRKQLLPWHSLALTLTCYALYSFGFLSIAKLHQKAFQCLFQGRSSLQIREWVTRFLDSSLHTILYPPAIEKLHQAQGADHLVVLLSSAPQFIVEPIATYLNIPLWQSTQYAVDKDGKFCHISQLMLGEDKAKFIDQLCQRQGMTRQSITAYSDSHLDLPFLQAAGHAVGVNPSRLLRAHCQRLQWPMI